MASKLRSVIDFAKRHKGKLLGCTAVGIALAAYSYRYQYSRTLAIEREFQDIIANSKHCREELCSHLIDIVIDLLDSEYRVTREDLLEKLNNASGLDCKLVLWKQIQSLTFSMLLSFIYLCSAAVLYSTMIVSAGPPSETIDGCVINDFLMIAHIFSDGVKSSLNAFIADLSLKQPIDNIKFFALAQEFDKTYMSTFNAPAQSKCATSLILGAISSISNHSLGSKLPSLTSSSPFPPVALAVWQHTVEVLSHKIFLSENNKAEVLVKVLPHMLRSYDSIIINKASRNRFLSDLLRCNDLDDFLIWILDEDFSKK